MVICHQALMIPFKIFSGFFHNFRTSRPDPVNDIMRTLGCSDKGFPTPAPSPLTRLNTPLGTPTLSKISAKITAANGVSSDGLSTTGLPAQMLLLILMMFGL